MAYLTPEQVAEMLQISPKSVYRIASQDASFPATRIGRMVRVEAEALNRWLMRRTAGRTLRVTA